MADDKPDVSPRLLRQDGAVYISEDMNGDVLFDSAWTAKLSEEEVLIGFETDGTAFKAVRLSLAGLLALAEEIRRDFGPPIEFTTGTVGHATVVMTRYFNGAPEAAE